MRPLTVCENRAAGPTANVKASSTTVVSSSNCARHNEFCASAELANAHVSRVARIQIVALEVDVRQAVSKNVTLIGFTPTFETAASNALVKCFSGDKD